MSERLMSIACGQLGPIEPEAPRAGVVARLVALLRQAHEAGATLVVFPELALTTFFPRYIIDDERELDRYFELAMPNADVAPLFEAAANYGVGFYLGYAEKTPDGRRFNSSVLVGRDGKVVGKYRKIHLPGNLDFDPKRRVQQLERRYFTSGDLGFPVWREQGAVAGMLICNDRRWPESFRVLGLQSVELVLLGYCTPSEHSSLPHKESAEVRRLQNRLTVQAGAYQNGTFVAGAAKAGVEGGVHYMADSAIIAPSGELLAETHTDGDELIAARIDLDHCNFYKNGLFNFGLYRKIENYGMIASRRAAIPPE